MFKRIYKCSQETMYYPPILTLPHLPYINNKTRRKHFVQKKDLSNFFQPESFADKQFLVSIHYSICHAICFSRLYLNHLILTN